jgi:hypothetical protein
LTARTLSSGLEIFLSVSVPLVFLFSFPEKRFFQAGLLFFCLKLPPFRRPEKKPRVFFTKV